MKICMFGAASREIDERYIRETEVLSFRLAQRGHSLVYGAGKDGLMGAAARGFKRGGGYLHGIVPSFFNESGMELLYRENDKTTYTPDMTTRKKLMEDEADAFIVTPGGVGTLDEMFEVLMLKQLGFHKKPVVVFNIDGYFDQLKAFIDRGTEEKFMNEYTQSLFVFLSKADEVIDYLETYRAPELTGLKYKLGEKA